MQKNITDGYFCPNIFNIKRLLSLSEVFVISN